MPGIVAAGGAGSMDSRMKGSSETASANSDSFVGSHARRQQNRKCQSSRTCGDGLHNPARKWMTMFPTPDDLDDDQPADSAWNALRDFVLSALVVFALALIVSCMAAMSVRAQPVRVQVPAGRGVRVSCEQPIPVTRGDAHAIRIERCARV
jgi:hypothetical protein